MTPETMMVLYPYIYTRTLRYDPTRDFIPVTGLSSFGFTNFRLATSEDGADLYRIVRADGSDVGRTLSEGEKGFITFLYFFNRIRGSMSQSGINSNRIVVFDDPRFPQPRRHASLGGGMTVSVGRIQACPAIAPTGYGAKFVVLSHNTVRGAAGGAILNAELLHAQGRLPRRAA